MTFVQLLPPAAAKLEVVLTGSSRRFGPPFIVPSLVRDCYYADSEMLDKKGAFRKAELTWKKANLPLQSRKSWQ